MLEFKRILKLKNSFLKKINNTEAIFVDKRVISIKLGVSQMEASLIFDEIHSLKSGLDN